MTATEQHLVIRHMGETSHLYFVALLLLQSAMIFIFWKHAGAMVVILWLVPQWLFAVILLFSVNNYPADPISDQLFRSPKNIMMLSLLTIGGLWASSVFIFKVPDSPSHLTFHLVLLLGIASSAVIPSSYWPPVFYLFPLPILVVVTFRLLFEDSIQHRLLGACTILYLLVMFLAARRQRFILKDVISLQQHNEALMTELRNQKEIAVSANTEKSRFLAAASHDLRQPIYAIGLLAANLERETCEESRNKIIGSIRRSASTLSAVVINPVENSI